MKIASSQARRKMPKKKRMKRMKMGSSQERRRLTAEVDSRVHERSRLCDEPIGLCDEPIGLRWMALELKAMVTPE